MKDIKIQEEKCKITIRSRDEDITILNAINRMGKSFDDNLMIEISLYVYVLTSW